MAKKQRRKSPRLVPRLGPPTNLRPAGVHDDATTYDRKAQKAALRQEIAESGFAFTPEDTLRSGYRLRVLPPFRLDLTVSVLRRQASNLVDMFTSNGEYLRAHVGAQRPVVVCVTQTGPQELLVQLDGEGEEHRGVLASVRRMLGVERDLTEFYDASHRIAWLHPLATRMRGVKPPRYPTLWEACVNAIIFQQISLHAASAILRRLIDMLGAPVIRHGLMLHVFPNANDILGATDTDLRAVGLSSGKAAALRRVSELIVNGTLVEADLETRDSVDAIARLSAIKGIGPWTATIILLRGLGRLDIFPGNDSGIARSLSLIAGSTQSAVEDALNLLGRQRGMLYYHLLLARLESRGELPCRR